MITQHIHLDSIVGTSWKLISSVTLTTSQLGDNCIQNFQLGRYIVGYTVGNLVLRRRASGAVKRDFRTYIRRYTFPNENFEYSYPHSNALLQFRLKFERCKPRNTARHITKYDVINDVKLFPAVYRRIDCRKFLTLSNQKSRYKSKCIRITSLWDVAVVNDTTIIITFPDNVLQFIYVAPRLRKGHKIDLGYHCYGADQFHHGIDVIDETIYLPRQDGHIMLLDLKGRTKRVLGAIFSKPILRYC